MNNNFVPLGTICSISGNNKKIMVIGYLYNDFRSGLKTYDYLGIPFPEGFLLPNRLITFNKNDISNIEFLGYQDEEYKKFDNLLNASLNKNSDDVIFIKDPILEKRPPKTNYIFNKDGLVIGQEQVEVSNPFDDYETLYSEAKNNINSNWSDIFDNKNFEDKKSASDNEEKKVAATKYIFDENGIVVGVEEG